MNQTTFRIERDSLGEVRVPEGVLYGAQTQRAVDNFKLSDLRMPRPFLRALARIKGAAASVNGRLGLLSPAIAGAIESAAAEVEQGQHDAHFPVDVFQTGSGTSTNMNMNEVVATLAGRRSGLAIHPNDHVNLCQSSNDVVPTAIHLSAAGELVEHLLPALEQLTKTIETRGAGLDKVVKTGRTHLMDAVPIRFSQEMSGWAAQILAADTRLRSVLPRLQELAIGGTAIGTGLNAHPEFGPLVAELLAARTGLPLRVCTNHFASISAQDTALELSAQLRGTAVSMLKVANDVRLMNSGPVAGLAEIALAALQPGSSIMPGKVNPVIPEAVAMVCAQVVGLDAANVLAAQSGTFQLNTMMPLLALNLLQAIAWLSQGASALGEKAIAGLSVNTSRVSELALRNPILATALAPRIGYEKSAEIAQESMSTGESVLDVAVRRTTLDRDTLAELLDPLKMTDGGLRSAVPRT
jgi:fumarate hydratase, class II